MNGPVSGLNPSRDLAMRQARQAYQSWQASPQGASPAQRPEAFQSFVKETAQRLRMSPQDVMQALAPYAGQAGGPMSTRETGRAASGAAAYLREMGMAVPPPPPRPVTPPAPPPLPPEERGFFDRLIDGASALGDTILDGAEAILTAPTDALAAVTADVPILGALTGALAESADQTVGFASGFVRGAGALVEGVAQMIAHPVTTVEGLWNMASHIPMVPANPFRLANAAWDIAVEGAPIAETLRKNLDPRVTLADDAEFGKNLVSAFTEPYREAWSQGRYGEAIGRGAFEVVTMLASGGGTAAARGTVEGASVAVRAARAAEIADVAGDAGRLARAAEVANVTSDVGRAAEAANAGRAAEAANAGRAAEAGNAGRAAEAGSVGRTAEAGDAARIGERAAAPARPAKLQGQIDAARGQLREAMGGREARAGGPSTAAQQTEILGDLKFSGLDEAGNQRLLQNIDEQASRISREPPPGTRTVDGHVQGMDDAARAEEILETLVRENPDALKAIYRQSYEAVGIDPARAERLIHEYTHSSSKVRPEVFENIGNQAKMALAPEPVDVSKLDDLGKTMYDMRRTRAARQEFIGEVLDIKPPDGYRVYRGTSNPDTVHRAAQAWLNETDSVAVTNRGVSSTSLDPRVAQDFSQGGPRSVTVDAKVAEYRQAIAEGREATMPTRAVNDSYVTFDMDIPNEAVVFDKYTDGGFSVDGTLAQRAQREVLAGGPNKEFLASSRRAQITYEGRSFMFEERAELFEAMRRNGVDLSQPLPKAPR